MDRIEGPELLDHRQRGLVAHLHRTGTHPDAAGGPGDQRDHHGGSRSRLERITDPAWEGPRRIEQERIPLEHLPVREAVRSFEMPLHLEWSRPGRMVDLVDRKQRARAYERALREGRPVDIASIVDGVLLVDLWDELVLPRPIRAAWQPLVDHARGEHG